MLHEPSSLEMIFTAIYSLPVPGFLKKVARHSPRFRESWYFMLILPYALWYKWHRYPVAELWQCYDDYWIDHSGVFTADDWDDVEDWPDGRYLDW